MNGFSRRQALWAILHPRRWRPIWVLFGAAFLVGAVLAWNTYERTEPRDPVSLSEVTGWAREGQASLLQLQEGRLAAFAPGSQPPVDEPMGHAWVGLDRDPVRLMQLLREEGVDFGPGAVQFSVRPPKRLDRYFAAAIAGGGVLFIAAMVYLFSTMFNMHSTVQQRIGTRVSVRPDERFSHVAGQEEQKEELRETVEFLRDPGRFNRLGARVPRGLLLAGPPGTGKTLMARAAAGEAGVPFFHVSGSEIVEVFVGLAASRVRQLFRDARRAAPCVVFIDEVDAIGRYRSGGSGGGHEEREQALNQILVAMDGFEENPGIVVIAATNRPDVLDPALLRPGRFDRRVTLDLPDRAGREAVLRVHTADKPMDPAADLTELARATHGCSGAELANIVNEAALLAARRGLARIGPAELEEGMLRVQQGPELRSRTTHPDERIIAAYHEAGHALVARTHPGIVAVHRVSIIPRGRTGGHTALLRAEERSIWTRDELVSLLAIALAGRVAEEAALGGASTGSGDDLARAEAVAREMVVRHAMGPDASPRSFGARVNGEEIPLHGPEAGNRIDRAVDALVEAGEERARAAISRSRERLEVLAEALLERETLSGTELADLLDEVRAGRPEGHPPGADLREDIPAGETAEQKTRDDQTQTIPGRTWELPEVP